MSTDLSLLTVQSALPTLPPYPEWAGRNDLTNVAYYPQELNTLAQHPYFYSYMDFNADKYTEFTPQHNGNNASTHYSNYAGEFPLNGLTRYAGYVPNDRYLSLFSDHSIKFMSRMITHLLKGVHPEGKNIIVPDATIQSVADSVFQNTGQSVDVMQKMIINYIVQDFKTEYETIKKNNKLSIWVQKYDRSTGMKQFGDVKLNQKSRNAYFQMRY